MFLALQKLHNERCIHMDINLSPRLRSTLNDYYFGRNLFTKVEDATTPLLKNYYLVTAQSGKYIINGQVAPQLTFSKGILYTFQLPLSVYVGHPFIIGLSEGVKYDSPSVQILKGPTYVNIQFQVPSDAPSTLRYYCGYHVNMGSTITISSTPSTTTRQLMTMATTNLASYPLIDLNTACLSDYSSNPRLSLQMSLYCAVAFPEYSTKPFQKTSFELTPTCTVMAKRFFPKSFHYQMEDNPIRFCPSNDVSNDVCMVHTWLGGTKEKTCDQYCSSIPGTVPVFLFLFYYSYSYFETLFHFSFLIFNLFLQGCTAWTPSTPCGLISAP